ncbi:DUF1445 domain-containing protein [Setomelanomma holmii]|uniref:DUF1445 domain-containing protein n=1 Tax=Setomelanomma holmii TaxID=210430 RepID=A0A9P4LL51_9PLEO|nr:DUF1445 domain-containing protein [Setomelanomma holmii]
MTIITSTTIAPSRLTSQSCTVTKTMFFTGLDARLAARTNKHTKSTSGLAPHHIQAKLMVLPSRYASDFRELCARDPVPYPLLAESSSPGDFANLKSHLPAVNGDRVAAHLDLRFDCPPSLQHLHRLQTCGRDYSFESALSVASLPPRHSVMACNVPMYRTNIPLNPAGLFTAGTYVVSMRPYKKCDIPKIRAITRRYLPTHGECLAWGWDPLERLGIKDINSPQLGDAPLTLDGRPLSEVAGDDDDVPVFWGYGVTPQEAVMRAGLEGTIMAHDPGCMLVLDCLGNDILV